MEDAFMRTRALIGIDAMEKLKSSAVAVFGLGGVGSYVAEALARSGIGSFLLVDNDTVSVSNINRQLIATTKTVGRYKVDVAADRIHEINPQADVRMSKTFFLPETSAEFDFSQYDYVVDAIDCVSGKIELAVKAAQAGTPIISCMGTGNKLDPTAFMVSDIYKTDTCPLARVMRRELRARGISKLKVVFSREPARAPVCATTESPDGRTMPPASIAFVPSVAGLLAASEVIKDLCG